MKNKDKNVRDFNYLTIELIPSSITLGVKMDEIDKATVISCAKKAKIQTIYQAKIDKNNCLTRELIFPQ